jgi:hypothetical protein
MFDAGQALTNILKAETPQGIEGRLGPLNKDERLAVLEIACGQARALEPDVDPMPFWRLGHIIPLLLRGLDGAPDAKHLEAVMSVIEAQQDYLESLDLPEVAVDMAERVTLDARLRPICERLRAALAPLAFKKRGRRLLERMDRVLGREASGAPEAGEAWTDALHASLREMAPDERAAWLALFAQARTATGARPSARWQSRTAELVAAPALGRARLIAGLLQWLPRIEKPKEVKSVGWHPVAPISDTNTRALVALVWALGGGGEPEAAVLLGDLAAVCFSKIAGYGAVSSKVGNACVWSLGAMSGLSGVAQLSRLRHRVKYAVGQRLIERSLSEAAQRAGLSVEDVEELAVPSFGLDSDGRMAQPLADSGWTAEVALARSGVVVQLTHPQKRTPKTIPAEVKSLPAWKTLKKQIAEIEQRLAIERTRLERYYLAGRELPLGQLRERVLEHPVVGHVGRRLMWNVVESGRPTQVALWRKGRLADLGNRPIGDDAARVSLWHPLGTPANDIAVWQDLLEQEGIVQPWKQAHREVYTLAADEQQEGASSRFAGHILRQHQFAALAQARGWRYRLMGAFDSHNTPTLTLPSLNLTVSLDVDYPGEHDAPTSGSGIYLHIRTGGVEFQRAGARVRLGEVPPLVFSEVMRDIDLLVSVSSIASDPSYAANADDPFADYWRATALGALTPTAATRHAVMARLLERLPDADRLSLDDRFLLVHGKQRRYRVHFGSGTVLLDPTDRVLVVKPRELDLQLPFEGDAALETILGTALALAADDQIREPQFRAAIGG